MRPTDVTIPPNGSVLPSSVLTGITASAADQDNPVFTGIIRGSVATGITATGSNAATAYPIQTQVIAIASVPVGTGAVLPVLDPYGVNYAGALITIHNNDPNSNSLTLYPSPGAAFGNGAAGAPVQVPAGVTQVQCLTVYEWAILSQAGGSVTVGPSQILGNPGTAAAAATGIAVGSRLSLSNQGTLQVQSIAGLAADAATVGGQLLSTGAVVALTAGVHRHFATVAALEAYAPTPQDIALITAGGVSADVQGYWVRNDFGGGSFDLVATGGLTSDGFSFFPSATAGYGWARRMPPWGVCPEMAGAIGNYTYALWTSNRSAVHDNTTAFTTLATYAAANGGIKIVLSPGQMYYLSSEVIWPSGTYIEGPCSTFTNGSQGSAAATWSNSRVVLSPQATWVFLDNGHLRNCLVWRPGLLEGATPTLAQVRAAVGFNGGSAGGSGGTPTGWLYDNVYNFGTTAVVTADTPQGAKGGASATLTFAANTWKPSGSGSAGATVYPGWAVSASNGSIPAGAVVETCTSTTLTISLGAINGDCPVGTVITVSQPSIALQFQGNGVCENVAVVGFFTGIQYLGNLQCNNCIVDAAGIAYEAVNNGANGVLTNCLANNFWSAATTGTDAYGPSDWRPGVAFMSHNQGGQNTGQSWVSCACSGYNFSMVWSNVYNNKAWNFGPEGKDNNGQPTFGLLTQNDCRECEQHSIYYAGSGVATGCALGLYHSTVTSHVKFLGGAVGTGGANNVVDMGPGSKGTIIGLQTNTAGTGYPFNFDAAISFWTILSPSCSGGAVPAFNIPPGAYGKVCVLQNDFGVDQTSAPGQGVNGVLILPNLPTTAPTIPGQIYVSPNGGLVETLSSGIGIGADRRATIAAEGTITLADLGHTVLMAVGTTAATVAYLPVPVPPLGSPDLLIGDDLGSSFPIVLNPGTALINNSTTYEIPGPYGFARLKATGSAWRIV